MDFNVKLQELRKQKGLTQEQLAQALFVSRTAVSKWESGRGYPNIDSLKAIANTFSVTVDELLSGDELLTIAQEDARQKENRLRSRVFGLLDLSVLMFLFLPLFGQRIDAIVQEASLLTLTGIAPYLRIGYFAVVISMALWGVLTLALQNCSLSVWSKYRNTLSLLLNGIGTILFIISLQPYAATVLLVFLIIKVIMLVKIG